MAKPVSLKRLEHLIKGYDIIFISVSAPTYEFDKKIAKLIRKDNKKAILCAIGVLATALPETVLKHFDVVILDGNDGPNNIRFSNHNNFVDIVYILDNIKLSPNVKIFLTHISHESGLTHNQLSVAVKQFSGYPIEIAKDGMSLEI